MLAGKALRLALISVAISSSVVLGLSFFAFGNMAGSNSSSSSGDLGELDTSSAQLISNQSSDNDYLNPCYGCNPTEDDYENLTTFELLAKYPELSGDPIGNETGDATMVSSDNATSSSLENSTNSISNSSAFPQLGNNTMGSNGTIIGPEPCVTPCPPGQYCIQMCQPGPTNNTIQ
jgi:hypothetical protein